MPKRKRTPTSVAASPWPPRPERSPNPIPSGQGAATKVGASTMGRSRAHTESPWRAEWSRGLQQPQMVHPTRNATGGARGLSPTETPEREDGNR